MYLNWSGCSGTGVVLLITNQVFPALKKASLYASPQSCFCCFPRLMHQNIQTGWISATLRGIHDVGQPISHSTSTSSPWGWSHNVSQDSYISSMRVLSTSSTRCYEPLHVSLIRVLVHFSVRFHMRLLVRTPWWHQNVRASTISMNIRTHCGTSLTLTTSPPRPSHCVFQRPSRLQHLYYKSKKIGTASFLIFFRQETIFLTYLLSIHFY